MSALRAVFIGACTTLLIIAMLARAPGSTPAADPAAVAAVSRFVRALAAKDYHTAFGLLADAQQRYFGSEANFASNPNASQYTILSYKLGHPLSHGDVVEVPVDQRVTLLDVGTGKTVTASVREPVFALRQTSGWGVKQLYQPWKAYAPNASGTDHGVQIIVDRIEFFDKRVLVDCTIRNVGKTPIQVLPLLQSTLTDAAGHVARASNDSVFPYNDLQFFEGPRIYPLHQAVGYINFALPGKKDETESYTLTVGPAIEDGGLATFAVTVGPFTLPKL